ncbi:MAG: hypothetical protein LBQ88_09430 [Treponema sp.]|jgi:hypothetical protein|nr:hypothetical protein [Treponema sp.]
MNILNNLDWDALTHVTVKGKNNELIDLFDLTGITETHAAEQKKNRFRKIEKETKPTGYYSTNESMGSA